MTTAAKKYPDFFKVFLQKQHSERMLIPNAFVKLTSLQRRIPENVILRNRKGRVWHVKIRSIGDKLYFDDGWKRFREENSLEEPNFLVFTYDGSKGFKFIILELSTSCEKTTVKEEEEEGEENDHVIELREEAENIEENIEEVEDWVMEDEEEQTQEEDSDDDDYDGDSDNDDNDDFDDDDYVEMEEDNEGEYIAGSMRSQCRHKPCRTLVVHKRETAKRSTRKVQGPRIEDYEDEAEITFQPMSLKTFVLPFMKRSPFYVANVRIFKDMKYETIISTCHNKQSSAKVPTQSLFLPTLLLQQGKRRGVGATSSTCNAASAEIFKIASITNGHVLIGVVIGFVLLQIEASVEEAE
ncbi:B3 domain-containing protein At5g60130-like [Abrus precatorius]|uniref:B3 domain-containing protein At5g60130-like n=1 Tax=Abrus precatorius TaxID=3816 RepID=A0A8B8LJ18_ABRPR|nr:B3 domain-containing protein At5g60130-like [Abrus precatorius]